MSDLWARYLCAIGIHWWRYVDTGSFKGQPFSYHHQRCRFCGRDSYIPA